jgi:DNA-binding beta-propeller fold protein YncE
LIGGAGFPPLRDWSMVMKKLLLILVPVVLFAQVKVDTVMRLPTRLGQAFFIPELNKLYVMPRGNSGACLYVLDCSTYTLKAQIPFGPPNAGAFTHFSWSPLRQKLYVTSFSPLDSTLVIDVATDTVVGWLKVYHDWRNDVYLSDIDARFKPSVDTLYEYECANDEIKRRLPIHSTCASWDSAGHKLYVGQGSQKKLYVYDYLNDSCLKVIDVSAVYASMPDALVFGTNHRAYVSPYQPSIEHAEVGIIDTERDTLLRLIPARSDHGVYTHVAVDERDGKAYMTDSDGNPGTPDTMWVVDCATDSVLKKFECVQKGHTDVCMRWAPWSNRIYLANTYPDVNHNSALVVIDCNTDSVIVPGMLATGDFIRDIQIDPIRQRIFVVGADSYNVYVLRDTGYEGVTEARPAGLRPASGLQVQPASGGFEVSYSIESPCGVDLSIHDQIGREVGQLVAEWQAAGQHRVKWDRRERSGSRVPAGIYFIQLRTPAVIDEQKVVVTR